MNTLTKADVLSLSVPERIQLVEDIWDSLAAHAGQIPVPDWHKRELDRRAANPSPKHITSEELPKMKASLVRESDA